MAPIPSIDAVAILVCVVLWPILAWVAIGRAADGDGRRVASGIAGVFLGVWLLAAFALSLSGVLPSSAPRLVAGHSNSAPFVGGALVIALILFLASRTLRQAVDAVPHSWVVAAQVGRLMGFVVLSLGLAGVLPMAFAGPAGWGDALTGLAAPFVAFALHRRVPGALLLALGWNIFGMADLSYVTILAAQTTPGTDFYQPAMGDNSAFSLFPLVLLQVVYGPMFILLHLLSLRALALEAFGRGAAVANAR